MRGNPLPELVKPAITKEQLALYAEASGDPNPIHLDDEVARKAGLPGVIAHGMLTMAFMGEFLEQALEALGGDKNARVAEMSCRFKAMTFPGDVITVSGAARNARENEFECDLETRNQKGEVTATGHAVLRLR
jgi:acyl dehydratase